MIKILDDPASVAEAAADLFVEKAQEAINERGKFSVALTGGNSPKQTYNLLTESPRTEMIPWENIHLFWGDERYVPHNDSRSNVGMAYKQLIDHIPVPAGNVHPVPYLESAEKSAETYQEDLKSFFRDDFPVFDLVYLGLGTNGHTASLFPNTLVLREKKRWYASLYLEEQQMYRTTLTIPAISHARTIAFIVFGENKADIVKGILEGPEQPDEWPAQYITGGNGNVLWLVDRAAAKELSR